MTFAPPIDVPYIKDYLARNIGRRLNKETKEYEPDLLRDEKVIVDEFRYKCQTDLFWLADSVLRNKKNPPLVPRVHKGICDTLVKKDPRKSLEEWSETKQRIIVSPRGTLKTVIESTDIVQIILCAPDVRILLLSGKLDFAKDILKMARGHFQSNDVLRYLFPEFCINIHVSADDFICPARNPEAGLREPTIATATFDSTKAGGHYEWLKLDDCTNEINCSTTEQVEKTIQQYDDLDPLLEPGGYVDFTGTRWAKADLPEVIRLRGEEYKETEDYKENKIPQVLYFSQPIWTLKTDGTEEEQKARIERENKRKLRPTDVNLLWPEKISAAKLFPSYRANYKKFAAQYLMNPEGVLDDVHFTIELLQRQTRPINEKPQPHMSAGIFINWDTAGIRSESGDYCVGVAGDWEYPATDSRPGRLYLYDCIMERFDTSTAMAAAIVDLYERNGGDAGVTQVRIEDAGMSKLIEGEVLRIAKEKNLNLLQVLLWGQPENTKDFKAECIIDLVDPLKKDYIQFFTGMPNREDIFSQFIRFNRKSKKKDDGPDCIAQLWRQYKNQIHPAIVLQMHPTGRVLSFPSMDIQKDMNVPDADEVSAANSLIEYTVAHAT